MQTFSFAKIIPSGNSTIILYDSDLPSNLAKISITLMGENHLQAEQVGHLSTTGQLPHLQMMGGEFCANATRASAALLVTLGFFTPLTSQPSCYAGQLTVSGTRDNVSVLVADTEEHLHQCISTCTPSRCKPAVAKKSQRQENIAVAKGAFTKTLCSEPATASTPSSTLHSAVQILCTSEVYSIITPAPGYTVVHLQGISHLLVDATLHHFEESHWQETAAQLRAQFSLQDKEASGVIWYRTTPHGHCIFPAVYVKATQSTILETACGSASLALSLYLFSIAMTKSLPFSYKILQPSGYSISVFFQGTTPNLQSAWIAGATDIIATGLTYI